MLLQIIKNIYHLFMAMVWRAWYGRPDAHMHVYGITGTNGKTTTSYLLRSVLAEAYGEDKVGMLTTVAISVGGKTSVNETKMTTLPSRQLFSYLAQMRNHGVSYVVLETTSHALHQHRLFGVQFDGAIILNVAREHLDYHRTMRRYANAKEMIVGHLKGGAPLVGKKDDAYVGPMLERAKKAGVRVLSFTAQEAQGVSSSLPGAVNKENALAVSLLCGAIGILEDDVRAGINLVTSVPGRMEWVEGGGVRVLIDYAVTPDALERVYEYAKKETEHALYGVLGACGLRDRGKRPDMARVVAEYVDELVLTREDPWTEDETQIFCDLEEGLAEVELSKWKRIIDRKEALAYVIARAVPGDVVVVTGKGAETGMAIGHTVVPWNEKEIVQELLNARK